VTELNGGLMPEFLAGYQPSLAWRDMWREIAPGVLVRRHRVLDLNVTLVLGDERCLLVDTHSHAGYATVLIGAIRQVTSLPLTVFNTHAHFDHCFGNGTFATEQPDLEIWAHYRCRDRLLHEGDAIRQEASRWLLDAQQPEDAQAVLHVNVLAPNLVFDQDVMLDLGGRLVTMHHPGPGHTDHDAVLEVPDVGVTIVGDLVEEGAPPDFADSSPLEWPRTLRLLLPRLRSLVVPGHGDIVDPQYVHEQAMDLEQVADLARSIPPGASDLDLVRHATRLRVGRAAGLKALRKVLSTPSGPGPAVC